jgi:16S rRNA (adenine1518-N6/adenine1519-N6)-dimethyltransferase
MQTLSEIRQLLADRGLRPKHRLGQNFLHDKNQLRRLIDAAAIKPGDLVLEVGPGTGTLTETLVEAGANVVACEIDAALAAIIADRFGDRVTLVHSDALGPNRLLNPLIVQHLGNKPFKLVANLPYQIASPLITALLIDHPSCLGQFVTIQKEVADRLTARPSTKAYGALSIIVQALADVERLATLSPGCFWPQPEVTSAMVAITPRTTRWHSAREGRDFAEFVVGLFTKRSKQLGGILGREHAWWSRISEGITPDMRPEALSAQQAVALWRLTTK